MTDQLRQYRRLTNELPTGFPVHQIDMSVDDPHILLGLWERPRPITGKTSVTETAQQGQHSFINPVPWRNQDRQCPVPEKTRELPPR